MQLVVVPSRESCWTTGSRISHDYVNAAGTFRAVGVLVHVLLGCDWRMAAGANVHQWLGGAGVVEHVICGPGRGIGLGIVPHSTSYRFVL